MTAYFETLKRTPTEEALTPILGKITSADVQQMFRRAKERTSSDSSTLNYTLWKCVAKDDTIAGILSILFSLPFMYGFANAHWTSMTDFMLEKKPGVRQIHTLRIIGKVAAKFNTCLKFLIGKNAMNNFENSLPSDDQHGFRPNRSSIDAGFLKLLTFECARMQKSTVGTVQHDMAAHFDRMYPAMTSIYAAKYGVDQNIMLSLNKTIAQLKRRVETALGISTVTYGNTSDRPLLGGMVQGKADVPQWSTQQSDALLKTHQKLTSGLKLLSPDLSRSIHHHAMSFADDTDGFESTSTETPDPIPRVVRALQSNAQVWSNLVQICGGLIALHKCHWQLIAWEFTQGKLSLVSSTDERLIMDNGHGTYAVIDFLPPDQPNVGLGYRICPDGSQHHHYQATRDAVRKICTATRGAHLTEAKVRQLLRQRLLPKLIYALHILSFSKPDCYRLNSDIREAFIPHLRLNHHFPAPILYGPRQYGGLEFPDIYTLQTQVQLDYLLKQLRWDKTVANDLLVTLDNVQLCTGWVSPILEHTLQPITYLDNSLLLDIRQRLQELDARLWIERAWTPHLQRLGDASLMETFSLIHGVTRSQLRQANVTRLYLRVITVADLCDPTGTYISGGMLNGDWRAGSDLLWPYQPQPPRTYFATFRRLLRLSICKNTPIHHHYMDSLTLDMPLGKWLPVPRNTWFPVYRTKDQLYWRQKDDENLFVLAQSPTSGFFHFSHTTTTLPLDSHPITYQQIGQSLWTQRPYRLHTPSKQHPSPPGHIVSNTLSDPTSEVITIGSDGSVYLKNEVAASAWMIATSETSSLSACFLLTDISSVSSYRSELEGIYRSLIHVQQLGLTPLEIQQWCDNESAVNDSNSSLFTPGSMIKPDADILLAIHHLRSQLEEKFTIKCKHVYGHQDTRHRDTPSSLRSLTEPGALDPLPKSMDDEYQSLRLHESLWETHSWTSTDTIQYQPTTPPHNTSLPDPPDLPDPPNPSLPPSPSSLPTPPLTPKPPTQSTSTLPLPTQTISLQHRDSKKPLSVLTNIECDRIATETAQLAVDGAHEPDMPRTLSPPYPGSLAMLQIGTTWITSHTKSHIHAAQWTDPIISYCMKKYGWSRTTIDNISWRTIKTARNKCTATQLMQTSKIMHEWLPVMHMMAHTFGSTQCPLCPHPDETLDHLFHCPHPFLQRKRDLILAQLRKKGLKLQIPYPIISAWCTLLQMYFDNDTSPPTFASPAIHVASTAQLTIGLNFLPRGYLSSQWIKAMEAHGCTHAERKLSTMILFLWVEVTDALWRVRNEVVHKTKNLNDMAQEGIINDQLRWFISNYRIALSRHDYKLLNRINIEELDLIPLRTKRQWIHHLKIAQQAFELEKNTLEPGQQLLTQYFTFRD